jgi:2'-5'-oligoadenylate synthetase
MCYSAVAVASEANDGDYDDGSNVPYQIMIDPPAPLTTNGAPPNHSSGCPASAEDFNPMALPLSFNPTAQGTAASPLASPSIAVSTLAQTPSPAAVATMTTLEAALRFPNGEKDINKCLNDFIRMSEEEKAKVGAIMDELHTCVMRHMTSAAVSKVVKSGSLGKGTATRDGMDVDVVVFAKSLALGAEAVDLTSQENFRRFREVFLKQLMWDFQECAKCERSYRRDCVFKPPFSFFTTMDGIPVDVLAAYDLLPQCKNNDNADVDWDKVVQSLHGSEFNTSLAELQKRFVKSKIGSSDRIKDLILLTKFWFKKVVQPQNPNCRVPSYFFELVCIHHWENRLKRQSSFKLIPALKGVLRVLKDPAVINIFWTTNYSKEHVKAETLIEFPLVLDPVNPTNNVAKFAAAHIWNQLSTAAADALNESFLQ